MNQKSNKANVTLVTHCPDGETGAFIDCIAVTVCRVNHKCPSWTVCGHRKSGSPCGAEVAFLQEVGKDIPKKMPTAKKKAVLMLAITAWRYSRRPSRSKLTVDDLKALSGISSEIRNLIPEDQAQGGTIKDLVDGK